MSSQLCLPSGPKYVTLPPLWMSSRLSKASKISMLGWWMVTMTVRPLRATFRTARITVAAALASRPGKSGSGQELEIRMRLTWV